MLKHVKLAVAPVPLVALAAGLTWTALSSPAEVDATLDTNIHVSDVRVLNRDRLGRGPRIFDAWVYIQDELGSPVSGAVVTGDFSGCFILTGAVATTDSAGRAIMQGKVVDCKRQSTCTLTFTVTDVAKEGFHYDPSANVVQSDSITLCR